MLLLKLAELEKNRVKKIRSFNTIKISSKIAGKLAALLCFCASKKKTVHFRKSK